jgi:putative lipoprotein
VARGRRRAGPRHEHGAQPDRRETRLRVESATPERLVLAAADPLAGAWERRPFAQLTGTVTYLRRVALTPEAVVQLELREVSRADAEAPLLAKRILHPEGKQVPIPFVLDYDPAEIDPRRAHAISARIADRGQLAFVTDTRIPVITAGAPSSTEIVVAPVR